MKYNPPSTKASRSGFSLVEMLSVIAVIGILAAIALPAVSNIRNSADTAKNRRNAQNLVSIFNAGQAAGINFSSSGEKDEIAAAVVAGATAEGGTFDGTFFGLQLSADDLSGAMPHLDLRDNQLVYLPPGGIPSDLSSIVNPALLGNSPSGTSVGVVVTGTMVSGSVINGTVVYDGGDLDNDTSGN